MRILAVLFPALLVATSADAADLTIAKTATSVSDGVNTANWRFLPGSEVDVALTVTNPATNIGKPVRVVVIEDVIAPDVQLRVTGYATAAASPVEFADGLPVSAIASGLTYRYGGLADGTDWVDFYNGTTWGYTPVADANGYDANVRKVRVTLTGTQATGSAFRLRYRTKVK